MATIQIKRKTSSGTGPLTGNGAIKSGEPLIDLNGGNLYIAKLDKTNNLATTDYIEFYNKTNADAAIKTALTKTINDLNLGDAACYNVGTSGGQIPVVESDGKLPSSIIPQIAITDTFVVSSQAAMLGLSAAQVGDIAVRTDLNKSFILKSEGYSTLSNWQELLTPTDAVTSVNGKTGAVNITLNELGGVSTGTFALHTASDIHLTLAQKNIISAAYNTNLSTDTASVTSCSSLAAVTGNSISGAIRVYPAITKNYGIPIKTYALGIDSSKVLTPSSTIDGGTY